MLPIDRSNFPHLKLLCLQKEDVRRSIQIGRWAFILYRFENCASGGRHGISFLGRVWLGARCLHCAMLHIRRGAPLQYRPPPAKSWLGHTFPLYARLIRHLWQGLLGDEWKHFQYHPKRNVWRSAHCPLNSTYIPRTFFLELVNGCVRPMRWRRDTWCKARPSRCLAGF